jgi:hypothetical protein
MMPPSLNTQPPFFGPTAPVYPHLLQLLRVTSGTVPGPSGYASSSQLGPNLYIASTQQLRTDTLLPRDREPCLAVDVNSFGLIPGYYLGRLAGSYQSLPVYGVIGQEIAGAQTNNSSIPNPLTSYLTPAQIATLNNLNACQTQVFLQLPPTNIQSLTSNLTPTQLSNLVNILTFSQLQTLVTSLSISVISSMTSALNQSQVFNLVTSVTTAQVQSLVNNLTASQLRTLANYPPPTINALVNSISIGSLPTFLNISGPPPAPLLGSPNWFPGLPTTPGRPGSAPSALAVGYAPIAVDTTNGAIWAYSGSSWVNVSGGGGGTTTIPLGGALPSSGSGIAKIVVNYTDVQALGASNPALMTLATCSRGTVIEYQFGRPTVQWAIGGGGTQLTVEGYPGSAAVGSYGLIAGGTPITPGDTAYQGPDVAEWTRQPAAYQSRI